MPWPHLCEFHGDSALQLNQRLLTKQLVIGQVTTWDCKRAMLFLQRANCCHYLWFLCVSVHHFDPQRIFQARPLWQNSCKINIGPETQSPFPSTSDGLYSATLQCQALLRQWIGTTVSSPFSPSHCTSQDPAPTRPPCHCAACVACASGLWEVSTSCWGLGDDI